MGFMGMGRSIFKGKVSSHPGGVTESILTVRVSGQTPGFLGTLVQGLPGNLSVSAMATFRQEGFIANQQNLGQGPGLCEDE